MDNNKIEKFHCYKSYAMMHDGKFEFIHITRNDDYYLGYLEEVEERDIDKYRYYYLGYMSRQELEGFIDVWKIFSFSGGWGYYHER